MSLLSSILLGFIQGLTEFLPVSSSGHLAIAEHLLGMSGASDIPEFFDVLLHLGTLVAVFVAYWAEVRDMVLEFFRGAKDLAHGTTPTPIPPARRMILLIIVGTLPLFVVLKSRIPKADLYHCVATGYAGVLGSMAKYLYGCELLISEHGIYTREREEEIIKASWVAGVYKNIWIEQFKKMSLLAYDQADIVTSLYARARQLQLELGCPAEKTRVTPNGIDVERLADLPGKTEEDKKMIHIGAVLRVTPIKDVKTMIQAFAFAKKKVDRLKLWIMGPCDEDEQYAKECFDLVEALNVKDVVFTGRVDIRDYLGRMDFTILTSISEGQPLTILESYAAHKPVIATDVGNCRELIYGDKEGEKPAGILTHIMNLEEISEAMLELAENDKMRKDMGEAGYERVMAGYKVQDMKQVYRGIYQEFAKKRNEKWNEEPFHIKKP